MHKFWGIIRVVVQVEAVKIYVAAVEALKENEREGQNRVFLIIFFFSF